MDPIKTVDRVLALASVLLVVLTVIFAQFMNAEKFWQGKAVDVEIRMAETTLNDKITSELKAMRMRYDSIHDKQKLYGRVTAGIMGFVVMIITIALPLGTWKQSIFIGQAFLIMLLLALLSLGIIGFMFAFGLFNP